MAILVLSLQHFIIILYKILSTLADPPPSPSPPPPPLSEDNLDIEKDNTLNKIEEEIAEVLAEEGRKKASQFKKNTLLKMGQ